MVLWGRYLLYTITFDFNERNMFIVNFEETGLNQYRQQPSPSCLHFWKKVFRDRVIKLKEQWNGCFMLWRSCELFSGTVHVIVLHRCYHAAAAVEERVFLWLHPEKPSPFSSCLVGLCSPLQRNIAILYATVDMEAWMSKQTESALREDKWEHFVESSSAECRG